MTEPSMDTLARLKERRQQMLDRLEDLHEMGQAETDGAPEVVTLRREIEGLSKRISDLEDQRAQGN